MKHKKHSLLAGLIAILIGMFSFSPAQVGMPEIFPFTKEFTILTKTAGGFNFDNDEYLDIVGIASLVDKKGKAVPRSSYLVHLEESTSNDFVVQWKYAVPPGMMADFVDIAVTDMDNDALPELVAVMNISDVGNSEQADWLVIFEYAEGFPEVPTASMEGSGVFATRPRPMFLHGGDLDGDNNTDLIISSGGPGRGIIVISAEGQVSSENLGILYQTGSLPTLQGVSSFRAITANLDSAPGQELVVFGGDDNLKIEVYVYEIPKAVISHTISDISRRDFDLEKMVSGDIDGDGYDEFIIPRKSGGALIMTLQDEQLVENQFLSEKAKINTLMMVDMNANGLTDILYSELKNTRIFQLEYDMSDILSDINSYRIIEYDNPVLKGFQYIDMAAVLSVSNKVTGAIILPFLNTNYTKHGLCRWRLEDSAPFIEEGPIDEVLGEVDQVLESKTVIQPIGEAVPGISADELIADLSGVVGEEVPLSPLPTTKTGMVSKMSISQVIQPDILVHPGEKITRQINIEDLTLDDLVNLTLDVDVPDGMKFDLPNKVFSWVPADSQLGLHTIKAEFNWGKKNNIQAFTVYVNDKPDITTQIPLRDIIQIGETFRLTIAVQDSNKNPFVGYKLINYPDGAVIDADGVLTWKPSFDQKDWFDFIVEVSDGYDTDRTEFALFVNHPVDIKSAAPSQTTIGASYHYQPLLDDKNAGFYVYWYDLSPRITDWQKSGIYELKIIDESVRANLDQYVKRFKNEFIPKYDPAKNAIKNHLIDDVFTFEDKLVLVFNILGDNAPEPDDVINSFFNILGMSVPRYSKPERHYYYTFTAKEIPNGMTMDKKGTIDWTPKEDQFDFHSLSYTVSDGYFTAEEHAQIYVNAVPVIVSAPDTITYVNSLWQYEIKTTDLNTDSKLSYELLDSPDGMIVSPQGVVSWTPTELQLNRHNFAVKVSDGMSEDIQRSGIFVNIKPKILSIPKPVALTSLKWEYQLDAEDSNGDAVVLKAVRIPKGAKFDDKTGLLTWKPRKSQRGVNDVVLEAVDTHGWSTLQEFQVHVFHNPGKQRFNFIRNSVAVLSLIGIIVLVTM